MWYNIVSHVKLRKIADVLTSHLKVARIENEKDEAKGEGAPGNKILYHEERFMAVEVINQLINWFLVLVESVKLYAWDNCVGQNSDWPQNVDADEGSDRYTRDSILRIVLT